jgi:hypothetical protein
MLVPGKLMISDGRGKRRTSGQNQKLNALVARSVDTLGIVLALFGLLGPNYCGADPGGTGFHSQLSSICRS